VQVAMRTPFRVTGSECRRNQQSEEDLHVRITLTDVQRYVS
jgi:hypothetical protein